MESLLPTALEYLKRGWSVIPLCPPGHEDVPPIHLSNCTRPGKCPLWPWKAYQERLPSVNEVTIYWKRNPRSNIGVAMGPVSGMIGLDIDGNEGEALLTKYLPNPPPTQAFKTPNNGRRMLFKIPKDPVATKTFRAYTKEALRILGKGTQTVMPPSTLNGEGKYEWIPGAGPDEIPLAQFPLELFSIQEKPITLNPKAITYVLKCEPAIAGQGGHNQTFKVATKAISAFALSEKEAFNLLLEYYNPRCQPPWTETELRHKVSEATKATAKTKPETIIIKEKLVPTIITAKALLESVIPETRWAIPGIIPEGLTIIAAPPKAGKSCLILGISIAVATGLPALGHHKTQEGEVLSISLEDSPRRLQDRIRKIMREEEITTPLEKLHLSTEWPRINQGCLNHIENWVKKNPTARMVVIDTLAKIRNRDPGAQIYDEDYNTISTLKALADRLHIAIVIIHHTRKASAEDPMGTVSGTYGLTGAADAVLVLRRNRFENHGKLSIMGRDIQERIIDLNWNPDALTWTPVEVEATITPDQAEIIKAIGPEGQALPIPQIAKAIKKEYEATKKLCQRMAARGILKPDRAGYRVGDIGGHAGDI